LLIIGVCHPDQVGIVDAVHVEAIDEDGVAEMDLVELVKGVPYHLLLLRGQNLTILRR
jgi:hypothetical protein